MSHAAKSQAIDASLDLSDSVDSGLIVLDAQQHVVVWNQWITLHSGREKAQAIGQSLAVAFGCPQDSRLEAAITQVISRGMSVRLSYALHPTPLPLFEAAPYAGARIKQGVALTPIVDGSGARGCLIQVTDVTGVVRREGLLRSQAQQLKQEIVRLAETQARAAREEQRFAQLAHHAPVGIFEIDATGRCVFANERLCQMTGLSQAAIAQGGLSRSIHPDDRAALLAHWTGEPGADITFRRDLRVQRSDGTLLWVRIDSAPTPGENGHVGHIGTCVDITETKQRSMQFEFRANHDALTGLLNRDRFDARLRVTVAGTAAIGGRAAVLYLDLDRFKEINDTHGHGAGDAVLKATAERLRRVLRTEDQPARLGGDEFAILLSDLSDPYVATVVADKVRSALAQPTAYGEVLLRVGCSVGWAVCPDDATDTDALIAIADARMYEDKRQRRQSSPPDL